MVRVIYVNGRYRRYAEASVHVEDRGLQFADSIYEGIGVWRRRLIDYGLHYERLCRSAAEIGLELPCTMESLSFVAYECIRRNHVQEGLVYVQVTRGAASRQHIFPASAKPLLIVIATPMVPAVDRFPNGVKVVTRPDLRWRRCDIKSTALLPNILAKQAASEMGAYDAWLIDTEGQITEGGSTNAWIAVGGDLVTRKPSDAMLSGVTRATVIKLARENGLKVLEQPFSVEEACAADEAFLTSTTSSVMPVVRIDERNIGDGKVGPVVAQLRKLYRSYLDSRSYAFPAR